MFNLNTRETPSTQLYEPNKFEEKINCWYSNTFIPNYAYRGDTEH